MSNPIAAATLARLRSAMHDSAFDWLLLGSPANLAYATGYRSVAGDIFPSHRSAALVGAGQLVIVAPAADAGALSEQIPAEQVEPFGTFFFESAGDDRSLADVAGRHDSLEAAFSTAIRKFGVSGRIGADDMLLGPAAGADLPVEPAESWIRQVRAVKLPAEVALLTRAAQLAESGIQAALGEASAGVTERQLARVVAATMIEGGGEPRFTVVTSGPRSALSDARPTDRVWQVGELLRFDVGCTIDGYWSDIGRTAVLGEPDQLTISRYQAIKAGVDAQLGEVRPGIKASALYEVAMNTITGAGLQPYRRHHCGHGIGREVYEPPGVTPGSMEQLQSGMVLCLETPFYEIGWGGMMVEDTLVVTGDGHQLLSRSDRSLSVIDP